MIRRAGGRAAGGRARARGGRGGSPAGRTSAGSAGTRAARGTERDRAERRTTWARRCEATAPDPWVHHWCASHDAPMASPRARPIHTHGRRSGARSSSLASAPTSASNGIRPSTLLVRIAAPRGMASATCHRGRSRASRYTHTVPAIQKVSGTSIIRRRALSTKIGVARRHATPATAAARPSVSTPIRHVSSMVPSARITVGRRAARSRSPRASKVRATSHRWSGGCWCVGSPFHVTV